MFRFILEYSYSDRPDMRSNHDNTIQMGYTDKYPILHEI
jgi:hypothetical protein